MIGGIMLVRDPNGSTLHLPIAALKYTQFKDFIVPGCILTVVVGGSNFAASLTLFLEEKVAAVLTAFAGLVVIGWVVMEITLTHLINWLQFPYLLAGMLTVFLSIYKQTRAFK